MPKRKQKDVKNEELTLQNEINELQLSLERNPNNNHAQNDLLEAKLRLQKIMHFKTYGAILRSKVRWYEEGECNTRYFFSLENNFKDMHNPIGIISGVKLRLELPKPKKPLTS